MINKDEAKQLLNEGLSQSKANETEILLIRGKSGLSRFANSVIHQSTSRQDDYLQVRAIIGKKIGIATTNQFSELQSVVDKAYSAAKLARQKKGFVSLPKEGSLEASDIRFSKQTAQFSPNQRADYIKQIFAQAQDYQAAGMLETSQEVMAVANTHGIFSFQKQTEANVNAIFYKDSESSYTYAISYDVDEINPQQLGKEAYEIAKRSKNPMTLQPGLYTVILQPAAVAEMLGLLALSGLGALTYQEKRSFMNNKIATSIAAANISIYDDASFAKSLGWLFDYEGVKRQKVDLIKDGIAKAVVYDSFTANRGKTRNTGHALPATSKYGPLPLNLVLETGEYSFEELISSTEKGILVNRFHYINLENPVETIFTGMTRDGTFLIEKGKATKPVSNLRFTQSILKALLEVEGMTKDAKLSPSLVGSYYVPAIKIKKFNFSS